MLKRNVAFRDLTILVLHHRTPDLLTLCLEKVATAAPGARVLVVDSSPLHERPGLAPDTEVLEVPNHSFAHMLNCGLKQVSTTYAAHLNADVFVQPGTLRRLLEVVKQTGVGLVGPTVRTPGGAWQAQGLGYRGHYARLARSPKGWTEVPWVSGCMQLVRLAAVAEVGGLDPSLRFYNEDMEWCFRLRRSGWACRLVSAEVVHLGGAATPKDPRFLVEGYRGGYKLSQRYHGRAYRTLHRSAVELQSTWEARFSRDPVRRQAATQINELFQAGTFDESPFGETLTDDNPLFPRRF